MGLYGDYIRVCDHTAKPKSIHQKNDDENVASYPPVIAHLAKRFRKCNNSFEINRRKVKTGSVLSTSVVYLLLMWKVNSFKQEEKPLWITLHL